MRRNHVINKFLSFKAQLREDLRTLIKKTPFLCILHFLEVYDRVQYKFCEDSRFEALYHLIQGRNRQIINLDASARSTSRIFLFLNFIFFQKVWEPCANSLPPPLHRPSICTGPGGPWTNATTYVFIVNWWLIFCNIWYIFFFEKKVLHSTCFKFLSQPVSSRERSDDLAVASY